MATSVDRELAAAREPIPVRRNDDSVSTGLTNAVNRSSAVGMQGSVQRKPKQATSFTTSGGGQEGWNIPNLSLTGIQTWLKLRTQVVLQPRLTADLGLDLKPVGPVVKPVMALSYQFSANDVDWATLRLTQQRAVICKSWNVQLDRAKLPVSFTLKTAAGLTYQGRPDFDVNVGDVKPNWLVGVAAVTLLVLRQPLAGVKPFGDSAFTQPFKGVAKGEAMAKIQRIGDGLELGLSQLNAVVRF